MRQQNTSIVSCACSFERREDHQLLRKGLETIYCFRFMKPWWAFQRAESKNILENVLGRRINLGRKGWLPVQNGYPHFVMPLAEEGIHKDKKSGQSMSSDNPSSGADVQFGAKSALWLVQEAEVVHLFSREDNDGILICTFCLFCLSEKDAIFVSWANRDKIGCLQVQTFVCNCKLVQNYMNRRRDKSRAQKLVADFEAAESAESSQIERSGAALALGANPNPTIADTVEDSRGCARARPTSVSRAGQRLGVPVQNDLKVAPHVPAGIDGGWEVVQSIVRTPESRPSGEVSVALVEFLSREADDASVVRQWDSVEVRPGHGAEGVFTRCRLSQCDQNWKHDKRTDLNLHCLAYWTLHNTEVRRCRKCKFHYLGTTQLSAWLTAEALHALNPWWPDTLATIPSGTNRWRTIPNFARICGKSSPHSQLKTYLDLSGQFLVCFEWARMIVDDSGKAVRALAHKGDCRWCWVEFSAWKMLCTLLTVNTQFFSRRARERPFMFTILHRLLFFPAFVHISVSEISTPTQVYRCLKNVWTNANLCFSTDVFGTAPELHVWLPVCHRRFLSLLRHSSAPELFCVSILFRIFWFHWVCVGFFSIFDETVLFASNLKSFSSCIRKKSFWKARSCMPEKKKWQLTAQK